MSPENKRLLLLVKHLKRHKKWQLTACSSPNNNRRNHFNLTVYSELPGRNLPPICFTWFPVLTCGWLLQQVTDTEKTELSHINCCNQPPQENLCWAWNTRYLDIWQWPSVSQLRVCLLLRPVGYQLCHLLAKASTKQMVYRENGVDSEERLAESRYFGPGSTDCTSGISNHTRWQQLTVTSWISESQSV